MNLGLILAFCSSCLSGAEAGIQETMLLPIPQSASLMDAGGRATQFSLELAGREFPELASAFKEDWPGLVSPRGRAVRLVLDTRLGQEEHRLTLDQKVELRAGSSVGLAWGLATLAQLGLQGVSVAEISDLPATEFRCLTLDVARRYHSPSVLRQMVRWCSAAKVRLIQLHLTDHQNWMLPTKVLAGIDRRNSHGRPAYSQEELRSLVRFAAARGVAIVPEIDVPGHSSLLIQHDPDLFEIKGSPSRDCINFASPKVRRVLKILIKEAAETFCTAPYTHLGGDEASHPDAEKDPQVTEALRRLGPNATVDMIFADFLGDLGDYVLSLKKRPIFWEGFHASDYAKKRIPEKALIVAWEGAYYPAQKLIDDGYSIINAGWDPLYVVNHYPWDAFTLAPLPTLYGLSKDRFGIVNWIDGKERGVDLTPSSAVKGAMLCWWEGHEWNAQATLPRRILAFGARLWNPNAEARYESFVRRADFVEKSLIAAMFPLGHSLASNRLGAAGSFADEAMLLAEANRPGIMVRAEQRRTPTKDSPSLPIKTTESGVWHLQAFKGDQPVGEAAFAFLHRGEFTPNLALGAIAVGSSPEDPQFPASRVTDGFADHVSSFWLAYPLPASLTIDLKTPMEANRVDVVPFWAAGQGCEYRVEILGDTGAWTNVTDSNSVALPVTKEGQIYRFARQKIRQVRVTVLRSAQYPPLMGRIHEVRVFLDRD